MLLEKIKLEPNEVIIKVVRKHWFLLFIELVGILLLTTLPLLVLLAINSLPTNDFIPNSLTGHYNLFIFFSCLWVCLCALMATSIWTHYYLDLWIITDRRIIVVDQITFFHRHVSSFRLERMQDIKVNVKGVIATFLNYGTIKAQTASATENDFITKGLPDPRGLQSIIQGAMDKRLQTLNFNPAQ